ncbi:pimeloyl-ACP methyl ester carboxylesterase [Nocardia tenerifensis]|uniref:Pimeloyl-ACP methyl ester carboxylesterase n=1 Tax=Nocardia tenerifensis TaxID=228006 RepID=A0A318KFM0_9NOCA|nr:alpha/beta hydrolase [Nocardia tenerifensis]PXX65363.1 pimeloyl-ACP methyl ester carboxylesterase [Nocardia tenerifensis]
MTTLNHHRVGAGEPLVLVHGIGSRWQVWEPIIATLAASYDVIAVDLPGFAGSAPLSTTTVDTLTDALAEFLAAQGLQRPHLAGNSMGGLITLALGARGLAESVTAFSPIGFWDKAGRVWCQQSLGKARLLARKLRPALPSILDSAAGRTAFLGLVFGKPWAVDARVAVDTAVGAADAPGFEPALASFADVRLPEIGALAKIPVTIAWGNRDILLTHRTQSRRARTLLPAAEHVTLHGSGHTPFYDDPAACARTVLDTIGRSGR